MKKLRKTGKISTLIVCVLMVVTVFFALAPTASADTYGEALIKSTNYLLSFQDSNGFWHKQPGDVPPFGYIGTIGTQPATSMAIMLLAEAYEINPEPVYLTAAENAGQALISIYIVDHDPQGNIHPGEWIFDPDNPFDQGRVGPTQLLPPIFPDTNNRMNYVCSVLPAWVELYKVTGNSDYYRAAVAAGDWMSTSAAREISVGQYNGMYWWYIDQPDHGDSNASAYHSYLTYGHEWLYGLSSLYELTGIQVYLDAAILAADAEMKYQYGTSYCSETAVRGWLVDDGTTFTDAEWAEVWDNLEGYWSHPWLLRGVHIETDANQCVNVWSQYGGQKTLGYAKLYQMTGDTKYLNVVTSFADWCLRSGVQDPAGWFYAYMGIDSDWEWSKIYGVRERITRQTTWLAKGLLAAYQLTGNQAYLDAVVRAGDYLVNDLLTYNPDTGEVYRSQDRQRVYTYYSQIPFGKLMAELLLGVYIEVDIDIMPRSDLNPINLSSAGVIPVAILSSDTFDATTVDPETVSLAGAGVKMAGKGGRYLSQERDVNKDGLMDLVCEVITEEFLIEPGQSVALLEAETYDGLSIRGVDTVWIVADI